MFKFFTKHIYKPTSINLILIKPIYEQFYYLNSIYLLNKSKIKV